MLSGLSCLSKSFEMASVKVPVQIDYSVGQQDFLDIVDNISAGDVEYTVAVRDPGGMPLYRFSSIQVVDKTSLSVLIAQHMAKDPHFGFGRDQRPYRWAGNRWEPVDKWFASIDYSLHALIRTSTQRRAMGDSFFSEALAAWQANSDYHQDGLELKAFGECPGIPFLDGVWSLDWGKGEHVPHDPKHLNTRVLPLTVDQAGEYYLDLELGHHDDSLLMKFLRSTLDEDQLVTIRRWFGYHLLSNRLPNAEKFLYLYGSGSNGKSASWCTPPWTTSSHAHTGTVACAWPKVTSALPLAASCPSIPRPAPSSSNSLFCFPSRPPCRGGQRAPKRHIASGRQGCRCGGPSARGVRDMTPTLCAGKCHIANAGDTLGR